jgi:hypothetical protein
MTRLHEGVLRARADEHPNAVGATERADHLRRGHPHARRAQHGQAGRASAVARHTHVLPVRDLREFCEPIERITGRKLRAFLSSTDTEVDGFSTETFVLHPLDTTDPRVEPQAVASRAD